MAQPPSDDLIFQMGRYKARVPFGLLYTKNHLWVEQGAVAKVGITTYRQRFFVDIQNVDYPVAPGDGLLSQTIMAKIEGVKAVAEIEFGLEGIVEELNSELKVDPSLINSAPYEEGWLMKVRDVKGELMTPQEYLRFLEADWKQTFEKLVQERTKALNIK